MALNVPRMETIKTIIGVFFILAAFPVGYILRPKSKSIINMLIYKDILIVIVGMIGFGIILLNI